MDRHYEFAGKRRMYLSFAALLMLSLFFHGCFWRDFDNSVPPQESSGAFFQPTIAYAPATTPGIIIQANFNNRHLPGKPFGDWTVRASWLNSETNVFNATTANLVIDGSGTGVATIPMDFLYQLLGQASDTPQAYIRNPGLEIDFYPSLNTWAYYRFD